jgi:hypothetical protein
MTFSDETTFFLFVCLDTKEPPACRLNCRRQSGRKDQDPIPFCSRNSSYFLLQPPTESFKYLVFFSYFLALPQKVTKRSRPPKTSTRSATFLKFLQKRVNLAFGRQASFVKFQKMCHSLLGRPVWRSWPALRGYESCYSRKKKGVIYKM